MDRTIRREASVSQLAESYQMSFAAVQKHVAVLERAGLVTKQAQGRERLVRANPGYSASATLARPVRAPMARTDGPTGCPARRVAGREHPLATRTPAIADPPGTRLAHHLNRPYNRPHPIREDQPMPVTSVSRDPESLTMTIVADFEVPVQRLWDAYADPANSSGSGAHRRTQPDSPGTTCSRVVVVSMR